MYPALVIAQPADAGPDVLVCGDEYDMLANTPAPPGIGVWTLISGCGFLVNDTDPNTHMYALCPGTSLWRWSTLDAAGVETSDVVEVTAFDINAPAADAGANMTVIGPTSTVYLNASPDPVPPMICTWTVIQGTGTIVAPYSPNTSVTGLASGEHIFRWTCNNGPCGTTSDEVTVQLNITTGIATTAQDVAQLFRYDPIAQQLVLDGTRPIVGLMVVDALGRSMPLSSRQANMRTWNVVEYPSGLYVLRALVDGQLQVYRFVVER